MKEFTRFKDLFIDRNMVTKKFISVLQKDALKWYQDNFGAIFGSTSNVDSPEITWHYSIGMLSFGAKRLGADYYFPFIIRMIHFERWKLKEWKEGFKYGKLCSTSKMKLTNHNYRDANPYAEHDFYRNDVWDAGYIMGLSNFSFKKYARESK